MIEHYSFGKIVIDGKEYTQDVIIYKDRVDSSWWRKSGHELHPDDLKDIIKEKPQILIVGTGYYGSMEILPETITMLKKLKIKLITKPTKVACEEYNKLLGKSELVAALHLTC